MFTGIIEEVGRVEAIQRSSQSLILTISGDKIFSDLKIGDSVAVNGVCLTATTIKGYQFTADVMPESIKMTTFTNLVPGQPVNLERAMAADGRFGGHIVAGHVDGTGRVLAMKRTDNATVFTIGADESVMHYVIYKGSIAIDGISLTISNRTPASFQVSIIPHTIGETILAHAKVGTVVNLETDISGRYIYHFMNLNKKISASNSSPQSLERVLADNGFI